MSDPVYDKHSLPFDDIVERIGNGIDDLTVIAANLYRSDANSSMVISKLSN